MSGFRQELISKKYNLIKACSGNGLCCFRNILGCEFWIWFLKGADAMRLRRSICAFLPMACMLFSGVTCEAARAQDTLTVGSDFGVAPWVIRGPNGPEGFGIDLINMVARKMGYRSVDVEDINFSGLFPALFSSRINIMVNPLNITQDRSERLLFSEPIFATGNGFIVLKGQKISGLADLRGKVLAVNRGTLSDTWATVNHDRYGFSVQRYETFPDSVLAVMTGRAFTALNEIPTTVYAASRNPLIEVGYKDFDGRNFGYAFRKDDVELRNRTEMAIECLKQEGALGRLYTKWYGAPPSKDNPLMTIYPGFGPPGFSGYDPAPHSVQCH
ncbi:substrate-binding periplasmic protein [Gluconobacter sphaericus]|uniref:substrate-binding periplasmic protein n=1 Tax=Gluconobacter sphaericus TaxID=574987 RepID=UPI00312B4DD8